MAESAWAKDMRREAQLQTDFAAAAYDQSVQGRLHAEDGARYSDYAAISASNAEAYAAEQLEAQLEQNEQVRRYHFAMWRQETLNGHAYESWRDRAEPVYAEFNRRWRAWTNAKKADIEAVSAKREVQAREHFVLDSRWHKIAAHVAPHWWDVTRFSFMMCFGGALMVFISAFPVPEVWKTWAAALLGLWLMIAGGMVFMVRMAKTHRIRQQKASEWVSKEKADFASSFPSVWGDTSQWQSAFAVHKTIESMPTAYLNFREEMLVDIPSRQPAVLPSESVPEEAVHTRSLLVSWA